MLFGKPYRATYEYAIRRITELLEQRGHAEPPQRIYAVGDNPLSGIFSLIILLFIYLFIIYNVILLLFGIFVFLFSDVPWRLRDQTSRARMAWAGPRFWCARAASRAPTTTTRSTRPPTSAPPSPVPTTPCPTFHHHNKKIRPRMAYMWLFFFFFFNNNIAEAVDYILQQEGLAHC